ncbi:hypothetical protein HK405_004239 [Cladochytrium tenue]|nr:hypothetical protein HK405_004239 [Cladochytrium tenue]
MSQQHAAAGAAGPHGDGAADSDDNDLTLAPASAARLLHEHAGAILVPDSNPSVTTSALAPRARPALHDLLRHDPTPSDGSVQNHNPAGQAPAVHPFPLHHHHQLDQPLSPTRPHSPASVHTAATTHPPDSECGASTAAAATTADGCLPHVAHDDHNDGAAGATAFKIADGHPYHPSVAAQIDDLTKPNADSSVAGEALAVEDVIVLTDIEDDEEEVPDGGLRAWLVVAASFVVQFWVFGVLYSYGVYNLASSSVVSFVGTLGAALLPMLGVVSGRLAERFGFQTMVLIGSLISTYESVLYGIGASIAYFPAVTIPNQFFTTRRGLATGIASSGSGFGGLVLSIATNRMISALGFAWALRITCLAMFAFILCALPFLRSRFEGAPTGSGARNSAAAGESLPHLVRRLLRDRRFLLLVAGAFFATFGNLVPIYFVSEFAIQRVGASAATGSYLLSAFDGAIGVGRVLLGIGADRLIGKLNALVLCMLLSGLSMLLMWTFSDSIGLLAAFTVVNGITSGGFISLYPIAVASLYGVAQLPSIYGLVFTIASVGNLAGSPLAGAIQEAAGYDAAIGYAGAVTLVSFGFVLAVRLAVDPVLLKRL